VKELRDGKIEYLDEAQARTAITRGAEQAVRRIPELRPFSTKFPLHVRLRLKDKTVTDGYIQWRRKNKPDWPGRRVADDTIEATLAETTHIVL
jgi:hypothetical protein